MLYIPIHPLPGQIQTAEELAQETSRKIYQLSTTNLNPNSTTQYYCNWIVHPSGQAAILELPEADTMPIALDLEQYDILDSLLQPFVNASLIPASTITDIHSRIQAHIQEGVKQGYPVQVNIFDMMPGFWQSQVMNYEQIKAAGFLPAVHLF